MPTWAIVPVKPFLHSKSRLASILSPQERAGLSREFLGHVLDVLAQVPAVAQTLVISRDPEALALARQRQARTVTELGVLDLNKALRSATQVALSLGADAVLILPTDLPFISPDDIRQLADERARAPTVIIAPDRRERGTNALFVRPPGLMAYAFGPDSFHTHSELAARAGAPARICRLPGTGLDIDLAEDWELYQAYTRQHVSA